MIWGGLELYLLGPLLVQGLAGDIALSNDKAFSLHILQFCTAWFAPKSSHPWLRTFG